MWQADEAWRNTLKSVSLADLVDTLSEDVPADIWKNTFEWVLQRAG
jgi:hypothetical protein